MRKVQPFADFALVEVAAVTGVSEQAAHKPLGDGSAEAQAFQPFTLPDQAVEPLPCRGHAEQGDGVFPRMILCRVQGCFRRLAQGAHGQTRLQHRQSGRKRNRGIAPGKSAEILVQALGKTHDFRPRPQHKKIVPACKNHIDVRKFQLNHTHEMSRKKVVHHAGQHGET